MFGSFVRKSRERLKDERGRQFSLRQVAIRVGIEPAYLSKIENGKVPPPSEEVILKLAHEVEVDANELIARAGKLPEVVSSAFEDYPNLVVDLAEIIGRQNRSTPLTLKILLEDYRKNDVRISESHQLRVQNITTKRSPALWGKEEARNLLLEKGYLVEDNQGSPNSNSLLVSRNDKFFTVWPKTSQKVRQIRLGTRQFLGKRGRDDFYFGFVPKKGCLNVDESYDLFIVRGDIAQKAGLFVDDEWLAKLKKDGTPRKSTVIIIKDVERQPHKKVWDKWNGRFMDGWEWLP